jgi:dephospho-CoA kinase
MLLIGLTGSIGMGKSQTAKLFAQEGIPFYDADATVHALYDKGGAAVAPIGAAFPEAIRDGRVDRVALSGLVLDDSAALLKLEGIVHPLARQAQQAFLQARAAEGCPAVVLDIPLLLEKNGEGLVDVIIVVSAPPELQKQRVLARDGMTAEKFAAITAKQLPDAEKRQRADFVVDTSVSVDDAHRQIRDIIKQLENRPAKIWAARQQET